MLPTFQFNVMNDLVEAFSYYPHASKSVFLHFG